MKPKYDRIGCCVVRYCVAWYCVVWYYAVWYCVVWYCVVWYCVVWYCGIDGVRGDNRGKLPLDHVAEAQARGNKAKAGRGVGK